MWEAPPTAAVARWWEWAGHSTAETRFQGWIHYACAGGHKQAVPEKEERFAQRALVSLVRKLWRKDECCGVHARLITQQTSSPEIYVFFSLCPHPAIIQFCSR